MRLLYVIATVASLLTENLALPVGKEGQREDVVTRCLVEVLSKALSKPDSTLDQECKDIIYAGVKHAPAVDKKSADGALAQPAGQAEVPGSNGADVKDIENLLKTVGEKREIPEDERSQESWSLGEEREKRSSWRPGRFHQRKHKRDEEAEEDYDRSQESWGVDKREYEEEEGEEVDKRGTSWRPRYQKKHKRDEETLGDDEGDEERSQEAWDVDKRATRYTNPHRYHHRKKLHSKRGDAELDDGERSQESWGLDDERDKRNWRPGRYHQRRTRRDEELSEEARDEPDEERSQEYWEVDPREKRDWRAGRFHQRRHKRDEEFSEPDYDRSQEYWDFDLDKRDWRPGRHSQRRHKREEDDGERSQESWGLDKRDEEWDEEGAEVDKRIWKPTHRYHHKKRLHKRDGGSEEEEAGEDEPGDSNDTFRYLLEKRNPWIYRGYYHPAWKRSTDSTASGKEKQLNNLAAMDVELQKIAAKLHDSPA